MPYDPSPVDADVDDNGRRATLSIQLEGTRDEPDTLLVLARPAAGRVDVREFPALAAPLAYDADVSDVLARIERAARERRRLGVDLELVRRWLAGRA